MLFIIFLLYWGDVSHMGTHSKWCSVACFPPLLHWTSCENFSESMNVTRLWLSVFLGIPWDVCGGFQPFLDMGIQYTSTAEQAFLHVGRGAWTHIYMCWCVCSPVCVHVEIKGWCWIAFLITVPYILRLWTWTSPIQQEELASEFLEILLSPHPQHFYRHVPPWQASLSKCWWSELRSFSLSHRRFTTWAAFAPTSMLLCMALNTTV